MVDAESSPLKTWENSLMLDGLRVCMKPNTNGRLWGNVH